MNGSEVIFFVEILSPYFCFNQIENGELKYMTITIPKVLYKNSIKMNFIQVYN